MKTGWAKMFLAGALGTVMLGQAQIALGQDTSQPPLDALHHALRLSPQQETAWQAYRAGAVPPRKAQERRRSASMMFPHLTAPQRMDLVEAEMKQELADLQRQSQALDAFYTTLNTEQKATFDAQTLPPPEPQQQSGQ